MKFPKTKVFRSKQSLKEYSLLHSSCEYCGIYGGGEVHHIVFRSQQGGDEHENLIYLCSDCHKEAHGVDSREYREKFKEIKGCS